MTYSLLVLSRIETDTKDQLVVLTLYPSGTACIKPRPYETLIASYIRYFDPGIPLSSTVSDKGKQRLKILLRHPSFTEDERRSLGTMYYSLLFGQSPGNDEIKKGIADTLYTTMCDLYRADASSEDAWSGACAAAIATIQRLADQNSR